MMTIAELMEWTVVRHWGEARRRKLEALFQSYTILPVDIPLCRHWAEIRAGRSRAGQPLSAQDAWIAATALRFRVPLVTHNPGDYQGIRGLNIITEASS